MTPGKDTDSVGRWRALLASERDAAVLYSRLADAETGERQQIFRELADIERRRAAIPRPGPPSLRTRLLGAAARRWARRGVRPPPAC
jgi:vacuolar iron transporter family protein